MQNLLLHFLLLLESLASAVRLQKSKKKIIFFKVPSAKSPIFYYFSLTLVGEKKNRIFSKVSNAKSSFTFSTALGIASLCRLLAEEQKENIFFQGSQCKISYILLFFFLLFFNLAENNKCVVIHKKSKKLQNKFCSASHM